MICQAVEQGWMNDEAKSHVSGEEQVILDEFPY